MSRKILDLLNGPNDLLTRIPGLTDGDVEIFGAWLDQLRRGLADTVTVAQFIASRQNVNGTWTVVIDGEPIKARSGAPLSLQPLTEFGKAIEPPQNATREQLRRWLDTHPRDPADDDKERLRDLWNERPETSAEGRLMAERLASYLRTPPREIPAWPHQEYARELSNEGRTYFATWLAQWQHHQRQPLRRCAQPACGTPNGRLFVAKRNERDCPYCRRQRSKSTRQRHRSNVSRRLTPTS